MWYVMYNRYINTEVLHRKHLLVGVSLKGVGMTYRQKRLRVVFCVLFFRYCLTIPFYYRKLQTWDVRHTIKCEFVGRRKNERSNTL